MVCVVSHAQTPQLLKLRPTLLDIESLFKAPPPESRDAFEALCEYLHSSPDDSEPQHPGHTLQGQLRGQEGGEGGAGGGEGEGWGSTGRASGGKGDAGGERDGAGSRRMDVIGTAQARPQSEGGRGEASGGLGQEEMRLLCYSLRIPTSGARDTQGLVQRLRAGLVAAAVGAGGGEMVGSLPPLDDEEMEGGDYASIRTPRQRLHTQGLSQGHPKGPSRTPYSEVFSNLYFLLAKSEEPLEGEPGFLAEEGPEAEAEVERKALYLLSDLAFVPTRPQSWGWLTCLYDEVLALYT